MKVICDKCGVFLKRHAPLWNGDIRSGDGYDGHHVVVTADDAVFEGWE